MKGRSSFAALEGLSVNLAGPQNVIALEISRKRRKLESNSESIPSKTQNSLTNSGTS